MKVYQASSAQFVNCINQPDYNTFQNIIEALIKIYTMASNVKSKQVRFDDTIEIIGVSESDFDMEREKEILSHFMKPEYNTPKKLFSNESDVENKPSKDFLQGLGALMSKRAPLPPISAKSIEDTSLKSNPNSESDTISDLKNDTISDAKRDPVGEPENTSKNSEVKQNDQNDSEYVKDKITGRWISKSQLDAKERIEKVNEKWNSNL